MILLIISHTLPVKDIIMEYVATDYYEKAKNFRVWIQCMIILGLAFLIYLLAPGVTPQFIYFQF